MMVIIHIIFSWVNNFSPTQQFLGLLVEPILRPIRDKIPKLGMLDLSPLALVVIIQILQIIVANIKQSI
jgi:YggT family protein